MSKSTLFVMIPFVLAALPGGCPAQTKHRSPREDARPKQREISRDDYPSLLMFDLGKSLAFAALLTANERDAGSYLRRARLICGTLGTTAPELEDRNGDRVKDGTDTDRAVRALDFVLHVAPRELTGPIRRKHGQREVNAFELGLKVMLLPKFGQLPSVRDAVGSVIGRCGPRTELPEHLWEPLRRVLTEKTRDAKKENRVLATMLRDMDFALKTALKLRTERDRVLPAREAEKPSKAAMRRRVELWDLGYMVMPYAVAAIDEHPDASKMRGRFERLATRAGVALPPLTDDKGTPLKELDSRQRFLRAARWAMTCGDLIHNGLAKNAGAGDAAAFRLGLDTSLSALISNGSESLRTSMSRRLLKNGRLSDLPEAAWRPLARRLETPCELSEFRPLKDAAREEIRALKDELTFGRSSR
jgi:hypothetical protein